MRILSILLLMFCGLNLQAANPSFSSFSQTDFTTNGLIVRVRATNLLAQFVSTNYFLAEGTNIVIVTTVDGSGTNVTMTINTPVNNLWELIGDHMRTTGSTTNDWQFRYEGTNIVVIDTNSFTLTTLSTNVSGRLTVKQPTGGKQSQMSASGTIGSFSTTAAEAQLNAAGGSLHVISNVLYMTTSAPYFDLQNSSQPFHNGWFGALNGALYVSGLTTFITTNFSRLGVWHGGSNDFIHLDSQASGIAGAAVGFSIESNTVPILGIGPGAQINFGGGGTNALYRSGSDLVVTNGSLTPAFKIINGSGDASIMSLDVNGFTTIDSSKGIISLLDSTAVFGNLVPSDRTRQLGLTNSSSAQWLNVAATRATIEGFDDGGGNYSQLAISMPLGTNGPIVFDSQSAGTAGPPVPMAFTNAPVILPWFTKAQKTSLTPAEGMILFQTDNTPGIRIYQSGAWAMISTVADP